MVTTKVQRPCTTTLLSFIQKYREMEQATYETAKSQMINVIALSVAGQNGKAFFVQQSHLMDQWKSKKKGFGQFFLNISWKSKIALLNHWGIISAHDNEIQAYLQKVASIEHYQFLNRPTGQVLQLHNMILFFENHGMNADCIPGLELKELPVNSNQRFGNSANWGNYIMKLTDRDTFFDDLFTNYKG